MTGESESKTKAKTKAKCGRKPWVLTPAYAEIIKDLAAKGVTQANIARAVNLNSATFSAKKKVIPELNELIEEAKAKGEAIAAGHLWTIVNDPSHPKHVSCLFFYLKSQHGWKDRTDVVQYVDPKSTVSFGKDE